MTSILLPLAALFVDLLIVVLFFSKKALKNKETRLYSVLIIVNLLDCLFNIIGIAVIRNVDNIFLSSTLQKIDIGLLLIIAGLLLLYFYGISDIKQNKTIKKIIVVFTLCISIFVQFVSCIPVVTDKTIDSSGLAPTIAYTIVALYGVLILVFIVLSVINNPKNLKNIKYIPLYAVVISALLCVVIRMYIPELVFEPFVIAYALLIMYFTIENPDIKMINTLNEAKLSAEKANRAKSDFLSSMSHEIRTPLNAIVGFSDCILEENTLEDAKSDAKDIKLASENLLEIVNGVLDISKIEADKMEIVEADYNLVETLENVVKLVRPRIGEKPIDLVVKFAPDLPYILYGDGGKLRQIVTNILTNAVKYTESGSITFLVNCINENNITKLVISVEDTGRGIKPEQIDKLFTKFQRLDEDKNTTLEGTGLGLAITKRFVEMMGGKIVVQSKYGEGSKFTVYLSQKIVEMICKYEDKPELINTAQIKLFDFAKAKVLIVDDNVVNIKVAKKILSNYGINADSAISGFECLDKIRSGESYDLILLDDMMPKMSGSETLKQIKPLLQNTAVVALTANAIEGSKEKYLSEGFTDYLSKPIEKTELYRILLTYLNQKLEKKEEIILPKMNTNKVLKKKILIVDDNKINIKIVEKLLSTYDYIETDSALSGLDAIEKAKNNNYDLVLMDIMMPGMDGVETMHRFKNDLGFTTPIVTLTADAVDGSREKYLNEGFDEYISKPLDKKIIDDIINRFLK